MLIGVDFDNTLVTYEEVFRAEACARGLIDPNFAGTKQEIRDRIRLLPDGEIAWQQLQGYVYGRGIASARMFDGAANTAIPILHFDCLRQFGEYNVGSRQKAVNVCIMMSGCWIETRATKYPVSEHSHGKQCDESSAVGMIKHKVQ